MLEIQMSIKAYDFSNPTVKNKNKYSLLIKNHVFLFPKVFGDFIFGHLFCPILKNGNIC
jgi:hypothetical protein